MNNTWTLIYRTDAQGNPLVGNSAELRQAVLSGADLKLLYLVDSQVWWSRRCASVSATVNGGILVSAVFMEAADTTLEIGGREFEVPFALEHHIYNSNGIRVRIKVDSKGNVSEPESRVLPMKWYVKDFDTVPPVLKDRILDIVDEHVLTR